MSTVVRRVAAIPARASVPTWHAIVALLAEPGSRSEAQLTAITPIAAVLISEEYTSQAPIVVSPAAGARVRIYTVHGDDAAEALLDELPLATYPTDGVTWSLSLPCGVDDLADARRALAGHPNVEVRDVTEGIATSSANSAEPRDESQSSRLTVDIEEMNRP